MLKNGDVKKCYYNKDGKYAYVPDRAMKHEVFLAISAGISTLDINRYMKQ
jgi:hypothetical protein